MFLDFARWVESSQVSLFLQSVLWIIPLVQCLHILAIAAVMSSVVMIEFKIFGVMCRDLTLGQTLDRFAPWVWYGLLLLAVSGSFLIIGEPVRSLTNPTFHIKMILLILSAGAVLLLQRGIRAESQFWVIAGNATMTAKILGIVTLLLWVGVEVQGRWIAFTVLE